MKEYQLSRGMEVLSDIYFLQSRQHEKIGYTFLFFCFLTILGALDHSQLYLYQGPIPVLTNFSRDKISQLDKFSYEECEAQVCDCLGGSEPRSRRF